MKGKVAIATGGGSGHLRVFLGYVGPGLLDGVSIGSVFSSPSVEAMVAVTKAIHAGKGVLTAVQIGQHPGSGWRDFLGNWTSSDRGRDEGAGSWCPD